MKKTKILKRVISVFLSMFMICCMFGGCEEKDEYAGYQSVYVDPDFTRGFKVSYKNHEEGGGNGFANRGYLTYGGTQTNPWWRICQWGFDHCLIEECVEAGKEIYEDGWYKYHDTAKKVEVNPDTGSIYLYVDAGKEYEHPRQYGEQWPSLLVDQLTGSTKRLTEYEELILDFEFTMTEKQNLMTRQEYNEDLHSLQLFWYVTLQDLTHQALSDYMWFGICPFDDRYEMPPEFASVDVGHVDQTNKFTFLVDTSKYLSEPVKIGEKVHVKYDVLPELKRAYAMAKERGFLSASSEEDMAVTSSNFGFEVTGTYIGGVKIDRIRLMAKYKEV